MGRGRVFILNGVGLEKGRVRGGGGIREEACGIGVRRKGRWIGSWGGVKQGN